MRRMARRALALALGTGIGVGAAAGLVSVTGAAPWSGMTLQDVSGILAHVVLDRFAPRRADAILEELEGLDAHLWAGRYSTPGIFPEVLLVAPDGGFTLYKHSGCGVCAGYEAMGRVRTLAPDRLLLEPEFVHHAPSMRSDAAQVVHLVEWGELRLAVLDSQVESFCAQLTARESMPHCFVRRELDGVLSRRETCPPGRPVLPAALAALVPEHLIACTLVGLTEEPTDADRDDAGAVNALFRLDCGSSAGLAVGMRLRIEGVTSPGRVESVEHHRATLRHWAGGHYNPPLEHFLGSAVRTLHPVEPADGE